MASKEGGSQIAFDAILNKNVPHILEKIFFNLDYDSFKTCQKVNKAWHNLLSSKLFKKIEVYLLNEKRENDLRLLHFSRMGNTRMVSTLLSSGVDPNCYNDNVLLDYTPLITTVAKWRKHNGHREVVKILLQAGANPDRTGLHGRTALHWAALLGLKNIVQLLLDGGAEASLKDDSGDTPSSLANINGHEEIAFILLAGRAGLKP